MFQGSSATPIDLERQNVAFKHPITWPVSSLTISPDVSYGAMVCGFLLSLYRLTWYAGPLRNLAMPLAALWLLLSSPFWIILALPLGYIAMKSPWKQIWEKSNPAAVSELGDKLLGRKGGYSLPKRMLSPVLALTTAAALGEGARESFVQVFDGVLKNCLDVDLKKPRDQQAPGINIVQDVFFWTAAVIGLLTVTPQFLLYIGSLLDKAQLPRLSCQTGVEAGYTALQLFGLAVAVTACTGNFSFGKTVAESFFHLPSPAATAWGVASSVGPYFLNLDADKLLVGLWKRQFPHLKWQDYSKGFISALISGCAGIFPALYANLKEPAFGSEPAGVFFIVMAWYYNVVAKLFAEYRDREALADEKAGCDLVYSTSAVSSLSLADHVGKYVYCVDGEALYFVKKGDSHDAVAEPVRVEYLDKAAEQLQLVLDKRKKKVQILPDGLQLVRIADSELKKIDLTNHSVVVEAERSVAPPAPVRVTTPVAGSPGDDPKAPLLPHRRGSYGSSSGSGELKLRESLTPMADMATASESPDGWRCAIM
jgi:hypothetical protein